MSFRERSDLKVPAVSRRSWLLPPGVVHFPTVDRTKPEIVDEAKHRRLGIRRIAGNRESDPLFRSPRNVLFKKAYGKDVVEGLNTERPICCATHWLSGMRRSIASMRPSRSSGG